MAVEAVPVDEPSQAQEKEGVYVVELGEIKPERAWWRLSNDGPIAPLSASPCAGRYWDDSLYKRL